MSYALVLDWKQFDLKLTEGSTYAKEGIKAITKICNFYVSIEINYTLHIFTTTETYWEGPIH